MKKLDPRIKDRKYIFDCFNADEAKEYIGEDCYMANSIELFTCLDLDNIFRLDRIDDLFCSKESGTGEWYRFSLCLPVRFVKSAKEKRYRPYTLEEFNDRFGLGEYVMFRRKNRTKNFFVPYLGNEYQSETEDNSDDSVHLGAYIIGLKNLFNNYEYRVGDEWRLFGVEE